MKKTADFFIKPFWFWIIAVTILVLYDLTPRIDGFDTPFYFLAGDNLWNGQLDCLRTPVYPFLLKLFNVCFGDKGGVTGIIFLQSIVYLISVASLRNVSRYIIHSRLIQEVVLLLYVVCVAPGWCNELMTESLSISGCVIITNLVCRYIDKPSFWLSIGIFITTLLLVFLRPSFIFLFAILPFVWFVLWIRNNRRLLQTFSLVLTLLCVAVFFGYCKAYEKKYGVLTSSISFVCNDIYNLKRSGAWNIEKVGNPQAEQVLRNIDEQWGGNYAPVYNSIVSDHKSLKLIADGCNEMIEGNENMLRRHQVMITAGSFDKRFNASVNTHTHLSTILFVSSLFLTLPLSIFYGIVLLSCLALIGYLLHRRTIPLLAAVLILFTAAQCVGIILYASEAHERLLLPVYPLFVILLGSAFEKATHFFRTLS